MTELAEAMRPLTVGPAVHHLHASSATRMRPPAPPVIRARLGAGISLEPAGLPPALLGSLKHAASLHNPDFYQREKRRLSTFQMRLEEIASFLLLVIHIGDGTPAG